MTYKKIAHGFTLIELVMVIAIMGIISVIVGRVLLQSFQMFTTSENIATVDWQGLLTMNRFTTDVHSIRSANDILTVSSNTFSFVDVSGTTVTYQLSGSALQRSGSTLASNVSGLGFTYYDQDYVVTATPSSVRYIALTATLTQSLLSQTFSTMAGARVMP